MIRTLSVRAVATGVAVVLVSWALTGPVLAETPSPTPTPSATTATPSAEASSPAAPPTPEPAAPTASSGPGRTPADADEPSLGLAVASTGGPVAGAFYEDLGTFAFSGTTDLADGSGVDVQRRDQNTWTTVASTTVAGGAYAATLPVQAAGPVAFRASAAGSEGAPLTSAAVDVTVQDATLAVAVPAEVDSLKEAPLTGSLVPARSDVLVYVDVKRGSAWRNVAKVTTAADGTFGASIAYGTSKLRAYDVRATYHAVNRDRWERSATDRFTRIAVIDAQVDDTTGSDVAKTYRKGCPVGPSKLSTIHLNYYGRDKDMHRGVIIVRTDLRQEIIRGFSTALEHRYPVAKMKNPNTYGGNDPRQMKANNTSGFNCRKVVGNPYKMSPHSYGIAIDVNTVQNPYRDGHGKWWPSKGKKYRDRTPLRWGMLGKKSWLTRSLRKDHFFWGGLWNPGRDYQHFEYRG